MLNQLKTFILLASLTAVLLLIGQILGGTSGVIFALIFALFINFLSYWYSDKIVLKLYRAEEINKHKEHRLYSLVHETAKLMDIPTPKIYMINQDNPNAFATGRNPKKSAVVFTKKILEILNDDELKGVIAHELSHIKNRDTLIQTIAATIAGAISYIASMAQWAAIFGGFSRDDDNNIIQLLFLAIIVPIAATIIQLSISRTREFIADETAAKSLHNGLGLASALEKLEIYSRKMPLKGNPSTASLFIVNPFKRDILIDLLSTHPSTKERVRRLRSKTF